MSGLGHVDYIPSGRGSTAKYFGLKKPIERESRVAMPIKRAKCLHPPVITKNQRS